MSYPKETKTYLLVMVAVLVIMAGFADLWQGGTDAASVLLVAGYVVLTPWAIWRASGRRASGVESGGRPPYGFAAMVGVALFALYVATLAPDTAMWDTSEYIAVAKVLGLPHPPGNPTFVLLAHVFGMIPLPIAYAARINLLAALASAASASLWFLCAERLLRTVVPARRARLVASAVCSIIGGTAFTVWNQSVVNEKVYTVSLFGLALGSWLVVRWIDAVADAPATGRKRAATDSRRGDGLLLVIAYLTGLAYTVHPAGFLVAPALGIAIAMRAPRTLVRWRLLLTMGALLIAGLTPFAFEPIRAGHHPAINEGVPTACTGARPEIGCTLSAETAELLLANIRREQYGGHPVLERQAPFTAQVSMFWLYFRWQWIRDLGGRHPYAQAMLAVVSLGLGIAGLEVVRREDRAAWWYFAPLAATLTFALIFYLNFKYGWSQATELGDAVPREVRDRDYFYVWTFSLWGLFAGIGLAKAWAVASRMAAGSRPRVAAAALAVPALALALTPLAANATSASRAGQRFTAAWAHDLLDSVAPYGVLVTNGDNDSFPLWYAQEVLGIRRDVTVALVPYLGIAAYRKELMRRVPDEYDAARGPARFAGRAWPRPKGPLWRMSPAEADAIPPYVELTQPMRFHSGSIDATIAAGYLTRDKLTVLRAIQDSFPERPFYFVGSGYAASLGLGPFVVQEGLVQRLTGEPAAGQPGITSSQGLNLDLGAMEARWATYAAPRELLREGNWVDGASSQIPLAYMFVAEELLQGRAARGDTAGARAMSDTLHALAAAARIPLD